VDDAAWNEALLAGTPHMLRVAMEEGGIISAVSLSLQEDEWLVGKLDSAPIQSIWSSLALELYYVSNHDDERYSIQSNVTLLRNLTVEAANPPLGYPAFVSSPTLL